MKTEFLLSVLGLAVISVQAQPVSSALGFKGETKAPGDEFPAIIEEPIARTVTDGGHATLSVLAIGTAPLSYQWWKLGQPLTNNSRVSGVTEPVLNIDPVLTNDTGTYFAIVANHRGAVTSAAVSLVASQPLLQLALLGATGAVLTVFGQVGDVYRVELSVNFGPYTTIAYATNFSGSAFYLDQDTTGGFRRLRAVFDHALPVLYAPVAPQPMNLLRAYGKRNQVWRLQSTTEFEIWSDVVIVTNLTGWTTFRGEFEPAGAHRFYRIAPP